MKSKEFTIIYPADRQEWRKWLSVHHLKESAVWVVFYKKGTGKSTLIWSEAVEEALCFGWIDSLKKKLDHESSIQFFSKRKPNSTWSKINKEKINRLRQDGLMMEAGLNIVEAAKKNGSWTILDEVEALKMPQDLTEAFQSCEGSNRYFDNLSRSTRKAILQWIKLAKLPETRQKRIVEVATLASQHKKPKQF